MPWPRIRLTLAVLACVIVGTIHAAAMLALSTRPRLEHWLARRY